MDERAQLSMQTSEAIEAELEKRTLAHKRRVDRIRKGVELRAKARVKSKAARATAQPPLDFLAIGDSWFEYPLNGNDLSFSNTAIAAQLPQMGNPAPLVLNYALHGQATTAVLAYKQQQRMIDVLSDPTQWVRGSPDAILVSMGGDDLVGDQFAIYVDYQGAGLDVARFDGALANVQASYQDLFAFRDIFAPGKTIFAHCYDYAIPNGLAPICAGPWLQPSLEFSGYDLNAGLSIVTQMIDRVHDMLSGLAGNAKNKFVLVDTRNTLQRVASVPNGWANELHPFPTGFMDLAQKFLASLRAQFPRGSI
jgi:hypothetical protein